MRQSGSQPDQREVSLRRTAAGTFEARNVRGEKLIVGSGEGADFTPVELLLAGIAGCSGIDVDLLTTRRAKPIGFDIDVAADKVRDEQGNHLGPVEVTFRVSFPEGPDGDRAREMLPRAIEMSRDRLCTVSRTVALPTPVSMREAEADRPGS